MEPFRFKHFSLLHESSSQRIGTDSVLLGAMAPIEDAHTVLDIGCGCGVVGFCVADRMLRTGSPPRCVCGIDIDEASVQEAQENAKQFSSTSIRFNFQQISLQQYAMQPPVKGFDLIVSNPPFFTHSLKPSDTRRQSARHSDETLPFDDLARCVAALLAPAGRFSVVLPAIESAAFEEIALNYLHLAQQTQIRPLPGKPVHRVISTFTTHSVNHVEQTELSIRDEKYDFTDTYRQLTKEFYLEF